MRSAAQLLIRVFQEEFHRTDVSSLVTDEEFVQYLSYVNADYYRFRGLFSAYPRLLNTLLAKSFIRSSYYLRATCRVSVNPVSESQLSYFKETVSFDESVYEYFFADDANPERTLSISFASWEQGFIQKIIEASWPLFNNMIDVIFSGVPCTNKHLSSVSMY